ncbi:MAG: hypothetical protein LBS63_00150 [Prevotellaceae bacterium]|jgi:cell fate regulator YaaT (PSP1 superfamily)|nr:hypothetical protein [Prevotellaceae bacterium]
MEAQVEEEMLYTRGCRVNKAAGPGELACSPDERCQKMGTFDWMEGLYSAGLPDNLVEVRFKNTRKGYFRNVNELTLRRGDIVAVEAAPGHDIGIVSLTGGIVARQMGRYNLAAGRSECKKLYRKARGSDIEKWSEAIALEHWFMVRARQLAEGLGLVMKVSDVEVQADKTKAIFYYIADDRIDFRELIKLMADTFKVRIEMRQIGVRQEAGRTGGIGTCGRELCCSKWECCFASVSTSAARYQDIPVNPQKLSGQCGKLKCCLNFELTCYIEAQRDFPPPHVSLETELGTAYQHKMDIFRRTMWYNFDRASMENLIAVSVDRVKEILEQNKKGLKVKALLEGADAERHAAAAAMPPEFTSSAGEDSITRFDRGRRSGRGGGRDRDRDRDRDRRRHSKPASDANTSEQQAERRAPQEAKPQAQEAKPQPQQAKPQQAKPDAPARAGGEHRRRSSRGGRRR